MGWYRRTMQTLRWLPLPVVMMAALTVGCGDDGSGSTGTTAGSATATATPRTSIGSASTTGGRMSCEMKKKPMSSFFIGPKR